MRGEPGGEGVGLAVGQDINHTSGFHVDQQGAVPLPLAEGEIVGTRGACSGMAGSVSRPSSRVRPALNRSRRQSR
jgi:hypothetical protein